MSEPILELVSRAHLAWKRRVARDLAPFGVNPKQIFLLRKLAASGGLSPSDIANLLYADRPTATSMLGTLDRAGWITRSKHPVDGRRMVIEITPKGRKKLASVPEHLWRTGRTRFKPEGCLDASERAGLSRLLTKLVGWLEEGTA
jgi:DNA-binding MarR family transcriptional regulator